MLLLITWKRTNEKVHQHVLKTHWTFNLINSDRQPSPSAMAPTTTIETITITRPLKVIAFICGVFVVILMIMSLTSTDWLLSSGFRQGLFFYCVSEGAEDPIPFKLDNVPGCHDSRDKCKLFSKFLHWNSHFHYSYTFAVYIKATAILCIITAVADAIATLLTGLGLKTIDANLKYRVSWIKHCLKSRFKFSFIIFSFIDSQF